MRRTFAIGIIVALSGLVACSSDSSSVDPTAAPETAVVTEEEEVGETINEKTVVFCKQDTFKTGVLFYSMDQPKVC